MQILQEQKSASLTSSRLRFLRSFCLALTASATLPTQRYAVNASENKKAPSGAFLLPYTSVSIVGTQQVDPCMLSCAIHGTDTRLTETTAPGLNLKPASSINP